MPDEGPLEHYLTVSHEPEPDIPEPAPERSPGSWRERGIMLGLGFLLGCIGAYALVYSEMSGGMRSLKQSLSEERDLNASCRKNVPICGKRWNRHAWTLCWRNAPPFP